MKQFSGALTYIFNTFNTFNTYLVHSTVAPIKHEEMVVENEVVLVIIMNG